MKKFLTAIATVALVGGATVLAAPAASAATPAYNNCYTSSCSSSGFQSWEMNPKLNWQANPKLNWQANPKLNWQANPNLNWKANPRLNPMGTPCTIWGQCR